MDETDNITEETAARPRETGTEVIARYLKHLGTGPGVYRMMDERGEVIYVGKARNLKARVSNYTRLNGHTNRIARMIAGTASMEFVSTATESEALLLEANLIKRFRPHYNVLMRDDKSFPYILISHEHRAPELRKHRGARTVKGQYYGPFASAGAVNRTLNMLQRAFLLRSCSDSVYESRTRPCLLHQIKRCSAPCTGEISLEDYGKLVTEAERFLAGKTDSVQKKLGAMMEEASEQLEFERAARYRDRLAALAHVQAVQGINPRGVEEADVFAIHQEGGQSCIQVFFFRSGQNWGNRAYFPRADRSIELEEILESFIAQFYDDKPVPRCIFVSHDFSERALLAEALSVKAERKVEIAVPQRGEKLGLVSHALSNAKEALGRKMAEASSQAKLLDGVATVFGLEQRPERIEVYDNSHIQGANAVGAMIVAGPEGFAKNQYRKFNIKSETLTPGDDYAMMKEVLRRRFARLAKERAELAGGDESPHPEGVGGATASGEGGVHQTDQSDPLTPTLSPWEREQVDAQVGTSLPTSGEAAQADEWPVVEGEPDDNDLPPEPKESKWAAPDLVLIDGGAGQLAAAHEVLDELGMTGINLAGIAKGPDRNAGREHFFMRGRPSFMLEPRDPVLYFVQRLRDESHRFAIGTHRAKRSKAIAANPLDEIPGIGAKRRRALLKHFGSAKAISRAGVEDLQAVEGISAAMAQTIYGYFSSKA
ncbi:MAG: excinuclease ABC subunit UvrC [Rhodomicrobiaceae bacterium]